MRYADIDSNFQDAASPWEQVGSGDSTHRPEVSLGILMMAASCRSLRLAGWLLGVAYRPGALRRGQGRRQIEDLPILEMGMDMDMDSGRREIDSGRLGVWAQGI